MSVIAIVVNYNGWRDTVACVDSLLRSEYRDVRVWVIDNGSTDGSLQHLRDWAGALGHLVVPETTLAHADIDGARVVVVPADRNRGFAGGCNVGLIEAMRRHPSAYILLLNSDATIAPDALTLMVRDADARPALGALGATIVRDDNPTVLEMLGGATVNVFGMVKTVRGGEPSSAPRPTAVHLDYVSGCCLLTRADAVARVGLMDERFFLYSEDVDWGLRMRHAGMEIAYCPAAEVRHKGGASVGHRSPTHDYYMVRGALMLVQKHFPWALPAALPYWAWRGILPKLARGQWARLRAASRGYGDFLRGALRAGPAPVPVSTVPDDRLAA